MTAAAMFVIRLNGQTRSFIVVMREAGRVRVWPFALGKVKNTNRTKEN